MRHHLSTITKLHKCMPAGQSSQKHVDTVEAQQSSTPQFARNAHAIQACSQLRQH